MIAEITIIITQWMIWAVFGLRFVVGAFRYRKGIRQSGVSKAITGEVVSFQKYNDPRQIGWHIYELIVEADGHTYRIVTDSTKAKKYRKRQTAVILTHENDPVSAILKEERPRMWKFWVLLIFGILLIALSCTGISSDIKDLFT